MACTAAPFATPLPPGVATGPLHPSRTLVMTVRTEPEVLTYATGLGALTRAAIRLFNAGVAMKDERAVPKPYLVEALPQLNTDSWQVFPDGRMETTYRLRPNLTWHDGTPLSVDDFVFAWRVYAFPELGVSSRPPHVHMEAVRAADERTVVIRWRRLFPDADSLMPGGTFDYLPLPRHILERSFEQDTAEVFNNLLYWTREYVGLGPFRLDRWELGAFLEGVAFEGHALGRPKIDRIRVVWIPDSNTVFANLLAGEAHLTDERSLGFPQGIQLKREWGARGEGTVLVSPGNLWHVAVQFRPERVNPRAVLDLRVRTAIAHAIDKEALNDGLWEGQGIMADTLVVSQMSYYPDVVQAIKTYPYDPRRTEQLMNEAGFTRGPDGFFVSPTEGRFSPEHRVNSGAHNEKGSAILEDTWRRAGIEARVSVFPTAQANDGQFRVTFPALDVTAVGAGESVVHRLTTGLIPRAETRWTGQNRGGWSNPMYDRLAEVFETTLDRGERDRTVIQLLKLASEELPWISLYFVVTVQAHVAAVTGPLPLNPDGTNVWNVHEWEFR